MREMFDCFLLNPEQFRFNYEEEEFQVLLREPKNTSTQEVAICFWPTIKTQETIVVYTLDQYQEQVVGVVIEKLRVDKVEKRANQREAKEISPRMIAKNTKIMNEDKP